MLEVVAEGPVPEHFEKGVVVGVVADVLEVVMLSSGADAFLGVGGAWWGVGGLFGAEEVGDELVHPGIGEEEPGGLGQEGGGGHGGVLLFLKKIEEALSDLCGSHDVGSSRPHFEGDFDEKAAGGWVGEFFKPQMDGMNGIFLGAWLGGDEPRNLRNGRKVEGISPMGLEALGEGGGENCISLFFWVDLFSIL